MTSKEKELKAFNQCADALNSLENVSIYKVFQLLSVHFDFLPVADKFTEQKQTDFSNQQLIATEKPLELVQSAPLKKNSSINKPKKVASSNAKDPIFLIDFDFMPKGQVSLKDFYNQHKSTSNLERNLIFAYYLQEVLKEPNISQNHIFSCYRSLNLKLPQFPSTLNDTKSLKGWIDTANYSDIKVTRNGINFLEHNMKIKQE